MPAAAPPRTKVRREIRCAAMSAISCVRSGRFNIRSCTLCKMRALDRTQARVERRCCEGREFRVRDAPAAWIEFPRLTKQSKGFFPLLKSGCSETTKLFDAADLPSTTQVEVQPVARCVRRLLRNIAPRIAFSKWWPFDIATRHCTPDCPPNITFMFRIIMIARVGGSAKPRVSCGVMIETAAARRAATSRPRTIAVRWRCRDM